MKQTFLLSIFAIAIITISCSNRKPEAPFSGSKSATVSAVNDVPEEVTEGKQLFNAKGCAACHNETAKVIGPSLKEITAKYNAENADLHKFLRNESEAIVDTNPSMVSIMKNNIETMVNNISDEDLTKIIAYIESIK